MVIVHPEYAMLILEINELREQIADIVVTRDMLVNYVCKELEIDYMLKIGALEFKLIVAHHKYKKNMKKLEMIEEKLDKNLAINMESIEKKINTEFKKQTKLEKEMSNDIDFAIEMSAKELLDEDIINEMNLDYFKLQKLYNPYLDLKISEDKCKMYKKIEKYYKNGNYKKLNKLAKDYDENYIFQDEFSNLKQLREKYIQIEEELKRELRKIRNTFPYNQKLILEDRNLYRRKKDKINKKIELINMKNEKIEKKIKKLLKSL